MRDRTYDLLCAALAKPGCALCRLERDHLQRYLDGFMYEDVTDVDLRAKMRDAQGFCREHAAQAIRVRDSLGLAIIYQDILSSVDKEMKRAGVQPLAARGMLRRKAAAGQSVARRITAQRSCPACAVRDEITEVCLRTLVASVHDNEIGATFQASDGLCLPHLRQALVLASNSSVVDALVSRQSQVISRLNSELAEFIRKHDHRFRHEQMCGEKDSWKRAIDMAVGQPHDDV
jgi:Family of unknown function (DUF6062)